MGEAKSMMKWLASAIAVIAIIFAVLPTTKPTNIGTNGYWRIEKNNDVWWFLNPSGEREFLNSVQTVRPQQLSRVPDGPHFRSKDYNGDIDIWAKTTAARVNSYGFKSLGAWCDLSL